MSRQDLRKARIGALVNRDRWDPLQALDCSSPEHILATRIGSPCSVPLKQSQFLPALLPVELGHASDTRFSAVWFAIAPGHDRRSQQPQRAPEVTRDTLATALLAYLISAELPILQNIIRSFPTDYQPAAIPATREEFLALVWELRDEIGATTYMPPSSQSSALEKLVVMSGRGVLELCQDHLSQLISLMREAAEHGSSFAPRCLKEQAVPLLR